MMTSLFAQSAQHAWRGLRLAFRNERNFRIQVGFAVLVLVASVVFPVTASERIVLLMVSGAVLVLELVNSTIERLADLVRPRLDLYVRDVKDVMAGAVGLATIVAVVVGLFVFLPHLLMLSSVL